MRNKVLLILCIFILISFLFINNCFALVNYPDVSETVAAFGHLYRKYIVISCNNGGVDQVLLWVFGCSDETLIKNSRFEIKETTDGNVTISYLNTTANGDTLQYQSYNVLDGKWNAHGYAYLYNGETKTLGTGSSDGIKLTIHESSHPVYYAGTDTIFSPETPATLGEIMSKVGEQATAEMTKVILIVIAVTVGLVILLIGLRKGLTALVTGLRH